MKDFFSHFEAIYCINLDRRTDRWEVAQKEFKKAGILDRVIRFSAFETPKKGAAGCLLSHRTIVQIAKERGWENVLVFEDDIEFIDIDFPVNFLELPAKWNLFYLGGGFLFRDFPFLEKSGDFFTGAGIRTTHGVAYHKDVYDTILNTPSSPLGVWYFLLKYDAFDAFLTRFIQKENRTFLYFICRQKMGISDVERKKINYSEFIDYNFFKIIHLPRWQKNLRRITRPLLQIFWTVMWPVGIAFYLVFHTLADIGMYKKYIRPYFRKFLKFVY